MSVAGWALKVPFLCGCRRLPEPPEPTKLPAHFGFRSFRVPERVAGLRFPAVAPALQEPLSGGVNDLVARVVCIPPPAPAQHPHGKHKGRDKQNEGGD